MEEHEIEKAVENAQLIRLVMGRSSESAIELDNVFIWWGIALILIEGACNILSLIPNFPNYISSVPNLILVPKILIALACIVIYYIAKKDRGYLGINNQLIILWLAIFGFNIIIPAIRIIMIVSFYHQEQIGMILAGGFIPTYSWISFVLGMLCMRVFARMKIAGWFVIVYLAIYIVQIFLHNFHLVFAGYIPPVSLLLLGISLKLKPKNNSLEFLKTEV